MQVVTLYKWQSYINIYGFKVSFFLLHRRESICSDLLDLDLYFNGCDHTITFNSTKESRIYFDEALETFQFYVMSGFAHTCIYFQYLTISNYWHGNFHRPKFMGISIPIVRCIWEAILWLLTVHVALSHCQNGKLKFPSERFSKKSHFYYF